MVGNKSCEIGDVEKESEKYCFDDSESKGEQRSKKKNFREKKKKCFLDVSIIQGVYCYLLLVQTRCKTEQANLRNKNLAIR